MQNMPSDWFGLVREALPAFYFAFTLLGWCVCQLWLSILYQVVLWESQSELASQAAHTILSNPPTFVFRRIVLHYFTRLTKLHNPVVNQTVTPKRSCRSGRVLLPDNNSIRNHITLYSTHKQSRITLIYEKKFLLQVQTIHKSDL